MYFAVSTTDDESLTGFAKFAVELMDAMGSVGAGVAIALENLFPPLPSEIVLPMAGFAASQGDLTLGAVIFWTTMGSLVGALVLYSLGALLGAERLKTIVDRVPLMKVSDVERSQEWFTRHGPKAVFFGRMIPIFRSLISIPAGLTRMNIIQFAVLTTLGSAIWNTAFIMCGYWLGENWHKVESYVGIAQTAVIAAVILVIAIFVLVRIRERRNESLES